MGKIMLIILILGIFSAGFRYKILGIDFDIFYVFYTLYMMYTVLIQKKKNITKNEFFNFFLFISYFLFQVLIFKKNIFLGIKQIIPIITIYITAKNILKNKKLDIVFKYYIKVAIVISYIGIIQFMGRRLNVEFLYNYAYIPSFKVTQLSNGLRINSIFPEPAHLIEVLIPALYISMYNLLNLGNKTKYLNRIHSILIMIVFVLANSSLGLLALILTLTSLIMKKIKKSKNKVRYIFFFMISISIVGAYSFKDKNISLRIADTKNNLFSEKIDLKKVNLSTYALLSNLKVSQKSLYDTFGLGSGIGTHIENHKKNIMSSIKNKAVYNDYRLKTNSKDAASLFNRIISEMGLVGIIMFIYFIKKFYIIEENRVELYLINNGIFILIAIKFLRNGHYFYNGFIIFLIMYIYSYKQDYYIGKDSNQRKKEKV